MEWTTAWMQMPMRRKHQADDFNIQLGIGVGLEGAKLPAGVLLGQALSNLLRNMSSGDHGQPRAPLRQDIARDR